MTPRGGSGPGRRRQASGHVNVIDLGALGLPPPRMIADLPGGCRRLMQHATGYRATLVVGAVVVDDGRLTDARPGRLARPVAAAS